MKKVLALVLVCMMALSATTFAADFKDMPDDWSTAALEAAVENGLLTGNGGYIKAQDNMTRAEMATIMVRACGATKEADISSFTDVKPEDWYYTSMSRAVAMGAFTGADNKLNPESPITRQEAFLVLSRVFGIDTEDVLDETALASFNDGSQVADWAKKGVVAILEAGYVAGDNGNIKPLANISRAEFAVVMDRLVKYYIDDAAATIPSDGNVMVRVPGVNLAGIKSNGTIVIGDGAGDAEYSVTDADIAGKLVVRSGKNVVVNGKINEVAIAAPGVKVLGDVTNINKVYVCKDSEFEIATIIAGSTNTQDIEEESTEAENTENTESTDDAE